MSFQTTEALLRSALEKIVYFEAKAEQLAGDVAAAKVDSDRLRNELSLAVSQEIELKRRIAELEVQLSQASAAARNEAKQAEVLRTERVGLLEKMMEAAAVHRSAQSPADGDGYDLAQFISTLRSEVMRLSSLPASPVATVDMAAGQAKSAAIAAQQFDRGGRLSVDLAGVQHLARAAGFRGRSEQTVFDLSVQELSEGSPAAKQRAIERLTTLGNAAAAPVLASALHRETSPDVLVSLLNAFAGLARTEGAGVVEPFTSSTHPAVRVAALRALLRLHPAQGAAHLSTALNDPHPHVRRRVALSLLSLTGEHALVLGEVALRDAHPEVRVLAALVLAASDVLRAKPLLLEALRDSEPKVRQAAARGLSRLLGTDVSALATVPEHQRTREIRKVAAAPVPVVSPATLAVPTRHGDAAASLPRSSTSATAKGGGEADEVERNVVRELRTAIRGRSDAELLTATGVSPTQLSSSLAQLVSAGQVVRRGTKYFVA